MIFDSLIRIKDSKKSILDSWFETESGEMIQLFRINWFFANLWTKAAITTAAVVQIVVDRAAAAVVKEAVRDTAVVQAAAEVEVDRDEAHTNNYSVPFPVIFKQ